MAEVDVDYDRVHTVSGRLTTEGADIAQVLKTLNGSVTELLTSQGGLWMQQASPVMNSQYNEFTASLTKAVSNLESFAKSFAAIVKNLTDMDQTLSKPPAKD
ncbi:MULTISPECIES: WXG100 family type VII secretion target [unclassified Micromonospora]|uniref:WXG100 family type VII secretion target n=1 Tax=Micromonospora sp. NPDC049903 TaxID=3364276 RepID=UPI003794372B